MKKIVLLALVMGLFSCKKSEENPSVKEGFAQDITIKTYIGWHGYRSAKDTIVNGQYYDLYYYTIPQIYMILDNTKVDVFKNGSIFSSGNTDANGEFKITGLTKQDKYSLKLTTRSFVRDSQIYHYEIDWNLQTDMDIITHYDIPFNNGVPVVYGLGTTQDTVAEPYY